jgi:hypothetical protein
VADQPSRPQVDVHQRVPDFEREILQALTLGGESASSVHTMKDIRNGRCAVENKAVHWSIRSKVLVDAFQESFALQYQFSGRKACSSTHAIRAAQFDATEACLPRASLLDLCDQCFGYLQGAFARVIEQDIGAIAAKNADGRGSNSSTSASLLE